MSYKFTIAEIEYEIPAFADIPAGALRKGRKGSDDMDRAFTILEEAIGAESETLAALDKLTLAEFGKWLEGWTQGAPLGESSSSSN
jgi:hypothetical protein